VGGGVCMKNNLERDLDLYEHQTLILCIGKCRTNLVQILQLWKMSVFDFI